MVGGGGELAPVSPLMWTSESLNPRLFKLSPLSRDFQGWSGNVVGRQAGSLHQVAWRRARGPEAVTGAFCLLRPPPTTTTGAHLLLSKAGHTSSFSPHHRAPPQEHPAGRAGLLVSISGSHQDPLGRPHSSGPHRGGGVFV